MIKIIIGILIYLIIGYFVARKEYKDGWITNWIDVIINIILWWIILISNIYIFTESYIELNIKKITINKFFFIKDK